MITAIRYHDISCGHRVVGHESKCAHLHGHNYRIHFHLMAHKLDSVGRVMDFGVIKEILCMWLEKHWDHKMLLWEKDQLCSVLFARGEHYVELPFNPTAENMAEYLGNIVCPELLTDYPVTIVKVVIEETRKCSVSYERT